MYWLGHWRSAYPDVHDVPDSVRSELLQMTFLDEESLWQIAKGEMASAEQQELQALLEVQQRPLFPQEQIRLQELRGEAMLRKARAYDCQVYAAVNRF